MPLGFVPSPIRGIVTDAPSLRSYLLQLKVWGPLAIGTLASIALIVNFVFPPLFVTFSSSLGDFWFYGGSAITTVVAAVSSFAWLRIYLAKRPGFACRTCGYDLQGSVGPDLACPECGGKEHRREVPAWGKSTSKYWLLVPGILLFLGAVVFLTYTLGLVALIMYFYFN